MCVIRKMVFSFSEIDVKLFPGSRGGSYFLVSKGTLKVVLEPLENLFRISIL